VVVVGPAELETPWSRPLSRASKTASKRDDRNGTQRDGRSRINLRSRDKLGLAERRGTEWTRVDQSGPEWTRAPMFRQQEVKTTHFKHAPTRPQQVRRAVEPSAVAGLRRCML
jgi:hypothetical protein